ncbi:MAG TPA: HIT family protein, partial [Rhizomicrobium sp.]|nr:HIT family protein [Rhizomicrobium sp.]
MTYDPNNVFAKILRGALPCVKIYEDEHTLSFMDIMPSVEGHTLVIPKEEGETIFDISPEAAAATIRTTQKVAAAVKRALDAPGILLVQLNGVAAGQSIPHVHFHVLPRADGL